MADRNDFNVWETFTEESSIAALLAEHPEVNILWERREKLNGPISINGVNPILHIIIEAIVQSQIQNEDPAEVKVAFERLQKQGLNIHAARGSIAGVLLPHIFDVIKEKTRFDNDVYNRQLKLLGNDLGKAGRNDSCLCGSGKKYKKCCLSISGDVKSSADAGKLILGANCYSSLEYLQTLPIDSTIIQLENRANIANYLEEQDVEGALLYLRENVASAEKTQQDFLINALQDLQLLCMNHPELSGEGIEANDRLISLVSYKEKSLYRCDKADLLATAGDLKEAEKEYSSIFEDFPEYDFAHYRYALFLDENGRTKEAKEVLRVLLDREEDIDEETYILAEELFEEISEEN